jgi:thiol-disulfide isomerase/thioredoxin
MKNACILLFLFHFFGTTVLAQKAPDTLKTQFLPHTLSQQVIDLSGQTYPLDSILATYQGKATLIYLWAAWCPDCLEGFPSFKKLQDRFPNLEILNLSRDRTETQWKKAISDFHLKGAHFWFGSDKKNPFTEGIDLNWIPRYLLIDQKGAIAHYYAVEADDEALIAAIDRLFQ